MRQVFGSAAKSPTQFIELSFYLELLGLDLGGENRNDLVMECPEVVERHRLKFTSFHFRTPRLAKISILKRFSSIIDKSFVKPFRIAPEL